MQINLLTDRGIALDKQVLTWKELAGPTYSKLDTDALTRVRVLLVKSLESEAVRFSHAAAMTTLPLRVPLARVRRIEQHQRTLVGWLQPANETPLESTIALEQTAVEVSAALADSEPDPYLASMYRFALLERFDHLHRFAALLDRAEGKDANAILQSYTDILPGRPTERAHRAPEDDIRAHYEGEAARFVSKMNALTMLALTSHTLDFYCTVGPMFADPSARALYAEIASVAEQHVTQFASLADPGESLIERWLLHEATEVYHYMSAAAAETDPRLAALWQRMIGFELGQLRFVERLLELHERRGAPEILPPRLPEPMVLGRRRELVRKILRAEAELSARGTGLIDRVEESEATIAYRRRVNGDGSPSRIVAGGWRFSPGGEIARPFIAG